MKHATSPKEWLNKTNFIPNDKVFCHQTSHLREILYIRSYGLPKDSAISQWHPRAQALLEIQFQRYGSHLKNLCQNLLILRWKSVIEGLCQVRRQVFRFRKNSANQQSIKDAVVLGWGRQIMEKLSQTMGITAVTVNACQRNMKNDTRGKFKFPVFHRERTWLLL